MIDDVYDDYDYDDDDDDDDGDYDDDVLHMSTVSTSVLFNVGLKTWTYQIADCSLAHTHSRLYSAARTFGSFRPAGINVAKRGHFYLQCCHLTQWL